MKITRLAALVLFPLVMISCSGGQKAVPQPDAEAYEVGDDVTGTMVLVASADSDFKIEIAERIGKSLDDKPVHVRFTSLKQLAAEDVSRYSAIIVMDRCVSWGLDSATESFLKKNAELTSMVVLFTSGDGVWKPDIEDRKFDAVTSASILSNADSVADEILGKIYAILDAES